MNVQVKHNGTTITGFVAAYEREHKVCTGIGTLRVEVVRTINRTFDTWDSIDIHENGSFKCRYYISSVEDLIPKGIIVLDCQDISKRLVDYFIPDSYTIDYPSYTRYWIEKFLTEAGVDVSFTTSSPGNIISNNTQLGLQPAYEQIQTLLQMSGWFIYYNASEEAVIGPLNADLAISGRSVGKNEILNISRNSDDKMLRNRALILGTFDPFTMSYASADVTVHTRWNYDHRDVRAVVISNSNIPNKGTAYKMANQIIKEFARITVEKHITVAGAKNWNLGDALRVTSTVWRGKGLITTFGTSMSKQGLVTNVILDERCPRLFGFFDYGDYVYVGTYGDGVWKKHIKFDPTFYDFSSGLTDLRVTDLHINNGVFGSVAASGQMYWTLEEGGWNSLTLSGLQSSTLDSIENSGQYVPMTFSGLMGRAVIVDKFGNTVKFGIDTYSGLNMGDYFLDYYASGVMSSGVAASGGNRGWIVEYDVMNGDYAGTPYPISYSGNYNFRVIDLENDGVNDYVSVQSGNGSGVFIADGYDLGSYSTTPSVNTFDLAAVVASPIENSIQVIQTEQHDIEIKGGNVLGLYDDAITGERSIVYLTFNGNINKQDYTFTGSDVTRSLTTHSFIASGDTVLSIYKLPFELNRFRVYYYKGTWTLASNKKIYYRDWDVPTNSLGTETEVFSTPYTNSGDNHYQTVQFMTVGNSLYLLIPVFNSHGGHTGGRVLAPEDLWLHSVRILLETGVVIHSTVLYHRTTELHTASDYEFFGNHSVPTAGGVPLYTIFGLFQNGDESVKVMGWIERGRQGSLNPNGNRWREEFLVGNDTSVSITEIYDSGDFGNFRFSATPVPTIRSQLTKTSSLMSLSEGTVGTTTWVTDGNQFLTHTGVVPYYQRPSLIYPIYSRGQPFYIAKDGSTWYAISSISLLPVIDIDFPLGYTANHPYCNATTYGDEIFWFVQRNSDLQDFLLKASTVLSASGGTLIQANINSVSTTRGLNVGGFFIHSFSASFQTAITYFYFLGGQLEFPQYLVLQREGTDFNLIQRASYPIRLDISNNAPVLTVGSGENSFVSNFVYDTILEQIIFTSGEMIRVDDYRYTYLEAPFSGVMGTTVSGVPLSVMGLYVTNSGVYGGDVTTYSGGFNLLYEVPSGYGARIETSNFGLGGQYVFVTTSGDYPIFYQKDPEVFDFTSYDGLPQSRATIIRLDDRM